MFTWPAEDASCRCCSVLRELTTYVPFDMMLTGMCMALVVWLFHRGRGGSVLTWRGEAKIFAYLLCLSTYVLSLTDIQCIWRKDIEYVTDSAHYGEAIHLRVVWFAINTTWHDSRAVELVEETMLQCVDFTNTARKVHRVLAIKLVTVPWNIRLCYTDERACNV